MQDSLNPFSIAQQQLDDAAHKLGLEPAMHELLRWPMQELTVLLPVKMDDGSTKVFHAFRVAYNTARGVAIPQRWRLAEARLPVKHLINISGQARQARQPVAADAYGYRPFRVRTQCQARRSEIGAFFL